MKFEDFDWAPPDVDHEELLARIREIHPPEALAQWISKYWTLRWPDGGLPPAE